MANYNSCEGPLIPAHVVVKYGIFPSDDDLTSSNSETEHDDLVSDEHGASWNIDIHNIVDLFIY